MTDYGQFFAPKTMRIVYTVLEYRVSVMVQ